MVCCATRLTRCGPPTSTRCSSTRRSLQGSVADYLGMPRISIALIPPMVNDDRFPPFWFGWPAGQGWLSRLRNRLGINLLLLIANPIFKEGNAQRIAWGLKPYRHPQEAVSTVARITQLPEALEFEVAGKKLGKCPLHRAVCPRAAASAGRLSMGPPRWSAPHLCVARNSAKWIRSHLQNHRRCLRSARSATPHLARWRARSCQARQPRWRSDPGSASCFAPQTPRFSSARRSSSRMAASTRFLNRCLKECQWLLCPSPTTSRE